MRRTITNGTLYQIEMDISQISSKSPGIHFLLETRIDSFFSRNQQVLKIIHKRMHNIQKRFIEHDEKEKPMYAEAVEGQPKQWEYLESATKTNGQLVTGDGVKTAYLEEAEDFLGRSVHVEL